MFSWDLACLTVVHGLYSKLSKELNKISPEGIMLGTT